MNIATIPILLNAAQITICELVSIGNEEERKQALQIKEALEENLAIALTDQASGSNHAAKVFKAAHKKLFERKLEPREVTESDHDFLTAMAIETEEKAKELFFYTKALAEIVKKNIPDDVHGNDISRKYTEITKGLNLQSSAMLALSLKYYFCEKGLEYFNELNDFSRRRPDVFRAKLDDLSKRMIDDLNKISYIACLEERELKAFQKILGLPKNFSERIFAKAEAFLHRKLDHTVELLRINMISDEELSAKINNRLT